MQIRPAPIDVKDPQFRYLLPFAEAAMEAIRRRLLERDGWLGLRVLDSILQLDAKVQRRKRTTKASRWILSQHLRIFEKYSQGKDLTEIAREEGLRRGNIIRIVRTAPFRVLELCGVIDAEHK